MFFKKYLTLLLIGFGLILSCLTISHASDSNSKTGSLSEIDTRIVGGDPVVDPAKYPWMASLNDNSQYPDLYAGHFCGGTLIAPSWVVTAMHCVNSVYTDFDVILGTNSLLAQPGTYERIPVKRIIPHPNYDLHTNNNDIALLQLAHPSKQTPISGLAEPVKIVSFETMSTVIGWGRTEFNGEIPKQLQEVEVPLIDHDICQEAESGITENMICAGVWAGGKDSCQGDSGGPLILKQDGQNVLAGIVSFGYKCAVRCKPGVYTRVSQYADWIHRTIQEECLFDKLEDEFPEYLATPSADYNSRTFVNQDMRYRSYPLSNSFISSYKDRLLFFGKQSNFQWQDVGSVDEWLKATGCHFFK